MEAERHLLSNHTYIEATVNNAIDHFLYEESFREERKICLNLVRRGQDVMAVLSTGSGRPSCFDRTQRKSVLNCIWNQILSETNRRK